MKWMIVQVKEDGHEMTRNVGTMNGTFEFVVSGFCSWWRDCAKYDEKLQRVVDNSGNEFEFHTI